MQNPSRQNHHAKLLRTLLRPLVRYCLRHAIGLRFALQALKEVFVELGEQELNSQGQKPTISRLCIMTGVSRPDIAQIQSEGSIEYEKAHPTHRILGHWEGSSAFQTTKGTPKTLSCKGQKSEFAELVRIVSADFNPSAMLKELIRLDLVEVKKDKVKIKKSVGIADSDSKLLNLLSRNIDALVQAAEENIGLPHSKRNLHARTEYDQVFVEDIPEVRAWFKEYGAEIHKKLRSKLAEYDGDLNQSENKDPTGKVVFCTFSYTEPSAIE